MERLFNFPRDRGIDLLAFGDPNIDLVFAVARAPAADEKVLGRRLGPYAGGTVANVACAAARLGAATVAYGRIGDDADGAFLAAEYRRFGVATDYLRSATGTPSAAALIMLEASGEKALVYAPMPGPTLEEDSLRAALSTSRLLYAMPYDFAEFERVFAFARAAGVVVAIDVEAIMVADARQLQRLMAMADVVFMNDSTYAAVLGEVPQLSSMAELLRDGPKLLVVTRGARGALAVSAEQAVEQAAFPATLVDSTGAGDCFNGAFLAALLEGRALAPALRFACGAGSIAVGATGARSALPDRRTLDALLAQH
jgi:sugar/nucleoside kinase (ribokinase family)